MTNVYLEGKIRGYEAYKFVAVIVLILCALFAGKYFFSDNLLADFMVGLALGVIGGIIILAVEYYINKQAFYKKGLKLEEDIAEKLSKLNIKYESHVETDYGDLDLLMEKDGLSYGIEAKNWAGEVTFENGSLKVANWDSTDVLIGLLRHCGLVRDKRFGKDSGKFIKPMLIFGYKAAINIPQNKVVFHNVEIVITTIKDFEQYIK